MGKITSSRRTSETFNDARSGILRVRSNGARPLTTKNMMGLSLAVLWLSFLRSGCVYRLTVSAADGERLNGRYRFGRDDTGLIQLIGPGGEVLMGRLSRVARATFIEGVPEDFWQGLDSSGRSGGIYFRQRLRRYFRRSRTLLTDQRSAAWRALRENVLAEPSISGQHSCRATTARQSGAISYGQLIPPRAWADARVIQARNTRRSSKTAVFPNIIGDVARACFWISCCQQRTRK